jgi:hypothetical protein
MKMRTNQRGHGLAPHPVVGLASILVVLAVVLVLVPLEGCEASRYCSYHPEAPECRGKQQQPRPPVDADDYDDGNDDGWDQVLQDEVQQVQQDVVDATVSAKTDDEARPPLQPAASQGWRELLHTRQLRTVFEALGAGALSLLSTASKGRYLNFSLCALARMTHDRVMDQLVLRW